MIKEERLKPLALIGLADRLAHSLLLGDEATAMLEPTDRHCRVLKLDPRPMKQLSSRVQASVTRLKALTASWGFDSGEPAWRRRVREQLGENIRPLYISEEPAFDSHGWFFRQTCSYDPQQPPNLAVLLIDRQENRRLLHEDLLSAEQEAGVTRLPLLIFSESGELSLPGLTGSRRVCLLPSTVHVLDVSEAIAALLDACVGAA